MGTFVMYTNIEREGWKKTLCTKSKDTLVYMINQILNYEERINVIIIYKTAKGDYPLYSFYNKMPAKKVSIEKAYQKMLSYGIK